MEIAGAVASIGTILGGLKTCYRELRKIRNAWQHGSKDLRYFSVRVKLFQDVLEKASNLIDLGPEHEADIREMGHHIVFRLKTFLSAFRDFSPQLSHSMRARIRTRVAWYFRKSTADDLMSLIHQGEASLNTWVTINQVCLQDERIKELQEKIGELERLNISISGFERLVCQLEQEKSMLQKQCKEQIREIKAIQREHRAERRELRDRENGEADKRVREAVDRFLHETIKPLIRDNIVVLGLDDISGRSLSRNHSNHSGLNWSRRGNNGGSTGDHFSSSEGRVHSAPSQGQPRAERTTRVSRSHVLGEHGELGGQGRQGVNFEHRADRSARESRVIPNIDQPYAQTEIPATEYENHDAVAAEMAEIVEEPNAYRSAYVESDEETLPVAGIMEKSREPQNNRSVHKGKKVAPRMTPAEVELQENRRYLEKQSEEHVDNTFREKRAVSRTKQEEAEAREAGRPQAHANARRSQSRRFRDSRHPEHFGQQDSGWDSISWDVSNTSRKSSGSSSRY